MSNITKTCAGIFLFLSFIASARSQWSPTPSGTTNDLRGVYLLDSGVAYAVGGAGTILKSTDAGMTWNALLSGTANALYDIYLFNDIEGVAVGDGGVILRTTDGGATWVTVASGVRDSLRSVSFNGSNGICGGLSQDILYSTDSGASWHVSQKGFFGGGFFGAHMLSPTLGFVTGQNSIFQGLQGTTVDGGVHWTFHTFYFDGNEGSADDTFFFDDMTGVTSGVLFDGTGAIARTANGGTDWNSTLFPQGMQGIDFPKPETGFAVGFVGTILKSGDLGLSWTAQTSGTSFDLFDVHFASDGLTGLAVGAAGTILRTSNGGQTGSLELVAAASRKGRFDIALPLTGTAGIECRSGGADGRYQVALTFNNPVNSVDGIATSCGTVRASTIDSRDAHQFLVSLAGVTCNAENVTLTITGVHDDQGNVLSTASVTMGLLLGDVSGDGVVHSTDTHRTKVDRGQQTNSTNFRDDIDTNGRIDRADFALIKAQVGTTLPP
ncbi:MAG TPA: YCF48-related protein [Chthoniobacterales bacterium]|nr:YCF48-related protein [Chthoniobacterales bacterium]